MIPIGVSPDLHRGKYKREEIGDKDLEKGKPKAMSTSQLIKEFNLESQ
jgi:hypothetical protein